MRRAIVTAVLWAAWSVGCDGSSPAAGAPPAAPAETAPAPDPVVEDPAPEPEAEQVFDFWRAIIAPTEHVGRERLCVADRVNEISDASRYVHPAHRERSGRMVACRRPNGGTASVVVLVEQPADLDELRASVSSPTKADTEVRLVVRVVGMDERGETTNAILVRAEERILEGDDDPHRRPSRCCRDRDRRPPEDEHPVPLPPHPGFDFDTWTDHVGTTQQCVVGFETHPQRIDAEHPPEIRTPPDVVIQMYAECVWAGGQKHLRLFFDADTAPRALWVQRGSLVRGTITGSGDLRVRSVDRTAGRYEGMIDAR